MEKSLSAKSKGLTHFKSIQFMEDFRDSYCISSLDLFSTRGVTGRLSGVGPGSESLLFSCLSGLFTKRARRYYNVFVEGGDVQPQPKYENELLQKKVISLDTSSSTFIRKCIARVLRIPHEREPFENSLAAEPDLFNRLWENELFTHVVAILWRRPFTLWNGMTLPCIRVVTVRDKDVIKHVESVQNGLLKLEDIKFIPYSKRGTARLVGKK